MREKCGPISGIRKEPRIEESQRQYAQWRTIEATKRCVILRLRKTTFNRRWGYRRRRVNAIFLNALNQNDVRNGLNSALRFQIHMSRGLREGSMSVPMLEEIGRASCRERV